MGWYFVILVVYFIGFGFTWSLLLDQFDDLDEASAGGLAIIWFPVLMALIGSFIWSKIFNR